eukprot:jgi/Chlat1/8668/Chrsp87S00662
MAAAVAATALWSASPSLPQSPAAAPPRRPNAAPLRIVCADNNRGFRKRRERVRKKPERREEQTFAEDFVVAPPRGDERDQDDGGGSGVGDEFEQRLSAFRQSVPQATTSRGPSAPTSSPFTGGINYDAPANTNNDDTNKKPFGWLLPSGAAGVAALFVAVSTFDGWGGLFAGGGDADVESAAQAQLSQEQKDYYTKEIAGFEALVKEDPSNSQAIEALAVNLAELGDYPAAAMQLEKLTAAKPNDIDALRLLGEVRIQEGEYPKAVTALRAALKASGGVPSIEVLRLLSEALISDGKPGEAVDVLEGVRIALSSAKAASDAPPNTPDPVQVSLLLGKAYAAWSKPAEAARAYDALIDANPTDFRGYLARAVLERQQGRKGEAEKDFVAARLRAPNPGAKAIVDRVAARNGAAI